MIVVKTRGITAAGYKQALQIPTSLFVVLSSDDFGGEASSTLEGVLIILNKRYKFSTSNVSLVQVRSKVNRFEGVASTKWLSLNSVISIRYFWIFSLLVEFFLSSLLVSLSEKKTFADLKACEECCVLGGEFS
jgi:hypothetical protein